jgi:TonB family protein
MGYQALLFCPDEKTARAVSQVLSELDFTVIPCTEPFGAVKKLMGEHFDAVVVDCDNEQNATLLFKSARNTPANQSALAVAVVEGQAGVAKAFRIGANLVLTKPINVEQAKGTLRVARGLLRKNEGSKPAAPAVAAVKPAKPVPTPPKPAPQAPSTKVVAAPPASPVAPPVKAAAASIPTQTPLPPRVVASVPADNESDAEILDIDEIVAPAAAAPGTKITASESDVLSPTQTMGVSPGSSAGFGSGAASAPAPAREPKPKAVISEPEGAAAKVAGSGESSASNDGTSAPAAFTFGGNVSTDGKAARGGSKKWLLVAAAVVIVAAGGYALWMQWVRSSGAAAPFAHVATPVTKPAEAPKGAPSAGAAGAAGSPSAGSSTTVPTTSSATSPAASSVPSAVSESAAAPKAAGTAKATSASDEPDADGGEDEPVHPSKGATKGESAKPSASSSMANKAPATAAAAAPIVIKSGSSQVAAKPAPTPDAPSITGIAPTDSGASLPNLMGGDSPAPAPVLQTLSVSQGVSRGLLVKKTQPIYPPSAMQMHVEGAVELSATISKEGNISAVKIISGDPRLARAAVDAVKQWKYKPYLLNGEPVEIQTQVTMNFKLPN